MFADVAPDARVDALDATFWVPLVAFVVLLLVLEIAARLQHRRELARVRMQRARVDHTHAYGRREGR